MGLYERLVGEEQRRMLAQSARRVVIPAGLHGRLLDEAEAIDRGDRPRASQTGRPSSRPASVGAGYRRKQMAEARRMPKSDEGCGTAEKGARHRVF